VNTDYFAGAQFAGAREAAKKTGQCDHEENLMVSDPILGASGFAEDLYQGNVQIACSAKGEEGADDPAGCTLPNCFP
jgi:hypothetical protein